MKLLLLLVIFGSAALPQAKPPVKPPQKPPVSARQPTKPAPATPKPAADPWRAKAVKPDASDEFFRQGTIPNLKLEIEQSELQKLRNDPRKYVRANLTENGTVVYKGVGVKLKGAAGSFRGVDDRPALTLNMSKYNEGQRFHALHKLHLNNSVQDPSLLSELLSSELFLAAGVPAARTTHARVWLNNRDLGLYVLKEGFDKYFLARHFASNKGNLYDGGFVQDIDAQLEKDEGRGPDDRSDLKQLVEACRTVDPSQRKQVLSAKLNIPQFMTFMGMEILTAHWDGYTRNRNNYRVYFEPTTGQAFVLPHGMDQMFADSGGPIFQRPGAIIPQGVLQIPEWEQEYHQRLLQLRRHFDPEMLLKRIDDVAARLQPVLKAMPGNAAADHANIVRDYKNRVKNRCSEIAADISRMPKPVVFDPEGRLSLSGWQAKTESPNARLTESTVMGRQILTIEAGPSGGVVASWRTGMPLPAGRYLFVGLAKATNVVADDVQGGAGIRISGAERENRLTGTTGWVRLEFPFELLEPRPVDLVVELKAKSGMVQFDAGSLKIRRAP
jgi:hypothetical protein